MMQMLYDKRPHGIAILDRLRWNRVGFAIATAVIYIALDEISYVTAGGVAEITLDRPDKLNAISARVGGTRDQILWALAAAEDDPDVGCVLLRGAGKGFRA